MKPVMRHIPNIVRGSKNDYFKVILFLLIILIMLIFLDPRDFEQPQQVQQVQQSQPIQRPVQQNTPTNNLQDK